MLADAEAACQEETTCGGITYEGGHGDSCSDNDGPRAG